MDSNLPKPIGHYSSVISHGDLLFCSGQIGQTTEEALLNLKNVLELAGSSLNKILKVTVFLTDISKFEEFNAVYAKILGTHKPARSTVEVAKLPKNALIEIEAIASL